MASSLLIRVYEKSGVDSRENHYDAVGNKIWLNYDTGDRNWEIDHIIPKSRGGSNHIDNYQALESQTNNFWRARMEDKPGLTSDIINNPNCWVTQEYELDEEDQEEIVNNYLQKVCKKREREKYIDSMTDKVRQLVIPQLTGKKHIDKKLIKRYSRQYVSTKINI